MPAMARMAPAPREGGPAQWAEAASVFREARLGAGDIRHCVAAEPEGIVGAGLAGRLSRRTETSEADRCSEHCHHDEPNASSFDILHLCVTFLCELSSTTRVIAKFRLLAG